MRYRYIWWSYVKALISAAGDLESDKREQLTAREIAAYERVAKDCRSEVMQLVKLVLIDKTHTIAGAAMQLYVCERTAQEWHAAFIKAVARELGLKVCAPRE